MVYLDKMQFHTSTTMITQTSSPSLSDSSPSLTQSMSNSSNSPPLPSTPPPRPSRTTSRYPDNLGRVPLHRRGNSQTYETLEDLLREAGYKETRIFTPEGQQDDVTYHEEDHESPTARRPKGGVGAVMEFLTGLLPSSTTQSIRSVATTKPENSSENQSLVDEPASAASTSQSSDRPGTPTLSGKTQRPVYGPGHLTPRTGASSMENLHVLNRSQSPIMSTPVPRSPGTTSPHSPYYSRYHPHSPYHQSVQRLSSYQGSSQNLLYGTAPLSRQTSLRVVNEIPQEREPPHQITPIAQPHPSRATAYLRRMASQRDVPERPSSTPVRPQARISLNDSDTDIVGDKGNGEGEEDHCAPPLPRSWIETVARAVLSGGSAAHIGGPLRKKPVANAAGAKQGHPVSAKGRAQALRHTRSSLSQVSARSQPNSKRSKTLRPHGLRSTLMDQTNTSQSKLSVHSAIVGVSVETLGPPELFLRVGRGRATRSESQVCPTRVYCRSAPSSRPASVVRDGRKDAGLLKGQGRARGGGKTEKNRVPTLAKTKAKGDMWTRPKKRKVDGDATTNRLLGGGGSPRFLRQRHQASIRLGDCAGCGYGSDAAGEHGYGRFMYGPNEGAHSDEDEEVSDEYDEDDEDDDEGELDLARMLVPAKRQNSIISLRKHLAMTMNTAAVAGGGANSSRATASVSRLGEGIGVGEFEREIEGGGGASAALSKVVGSASTTMSAMRIRGAYVPGPGPGRAAAKRRLQ